MLENSLSVRIFAAARIVRSLREFFVDPAGGEPQLVLARLFATERLADLPEDLQRLVGAAMAGEVSPDLRCLHPPDPAMRVADFGLA